MQAEVLIEYSAKSIDKKFTYLIPFNLLNKIKVGMKVKVPFGKQILNGFVVNIIDNKESSFELKEIISISDENFILNDELMMLGNYLKEITLCSLISAYQVMLPSSLKIKNQKSNYQKYDEYLELVNESDAIEYINSNKRSIKQNELLKRLLNKEKILKKEYNNAIIDKLMMLGLINVVKEKKYRINTRGMGSNKVVLTKEQNNAFEEIKKDLDKKSIFLLHGVTGSGKTEVYMSLIEEVLKKGKTVIFLVPEISLSNQMIKRFYDRFASKVAIFHSALSDGEKFDEYQKILNGDASLVVGTRSAIFVPFKSIGLIILDEEQSTNYKQDNNPRYHARDIAIKRSEYHNCPVVLGSATPSLESMARAYKGVYKLLTLNNRIGNSKLPKIYTVDMKYEYQKRNMIISDLLDQKIKDRLDKKEQVIIFLNRRGFTTMMTCKNCGYTYKCPNCDITLTYHKSSNHLRCHYCGYTLISMDICPKCNEKALTSYGLGTEKLEEFLKEKYPSAKVLRMDADTVTKKGSTQSIINKILEGNADIIIGTQMISKGFDFPKVTLVGIINADESLNVPDFRSGERAFELLLQTSGRAGRGALLGEVVIQTFDEDNKTISFVKEHNYNKLYQYEMAIRKTLKYPPYYYLTSIKIASKNYDDASIEASKVARYLHSKLIDVIILGPTTAAMFKVNNIYRFGIILKYKNFDNVKKVLNDLDEIYKSNLKVNLEIDNNPVRI